MIDTIKHVPWKLWLRPDIYETMLTVTSNLSLNKQTNLMDDV